MFKIGLVIFIYLLIGFILAILCRLLEVTDDEDDLTMVVLFWIFMGLFLVIVSPGYIANFIAEQIRKYLDKRKEEIK